jgi:glycerophosphoryl diester phosphodiesterase
VPTLAEAFEAHPDARWNVELKPAVEDAEPFCRVVREHGMERQVLAVSAEPVVAEVRNRCPAVATATHRREVAHLLAASHLRLAGTYDAPAQAVQVPRRTSGVTVLTGRFVEAAHGRGMDVHAWTINDPAEMRRLAEMGVDGLITDYPGRALSVLGRA